MTIGKILVPLSGGNTDRQGLAAAFAIAEDYSAHAQALFVRPDPADAVPTLGEGMTADVIGQIMDSSAKATARASEAARSTFDAAAGAAGIATQETPEKGDAASARLVDVTGRIYEIIPREARLADLTVLGHDSRQDDYEMSETLESALLDSGRPVLIVPAMPGEKVASRVAIAWDGSGEAARAVAGAKPFLAKAEEVHVLSFADRRVDKEAGARLGDYLGWHGINATVHPRAEASPGVGEALLSRCSELGVDLLVMGGYAHSRIREMIFGGATRHILAHAPIPVLLAH